MNLDISTMTAFFVGLIVGILTALFVGALLALSAGNGEDGLQ